MALLLRVETAAMTFPMRVRPPRPSSSRRPKFTKMGLNENSYTKRKLPILLFDIMDTIVRDPFYEDVPSFFGMSLKELLECKHPTTWIEFEKGIIDEKCMKSGYSYIEGVEQLLQKLKHFDYEMHTLTNYPVWYNMIEDKLKISTYMPWTFCSCISGKRKPDPEFYLEVVRYLDVDPAHCIFIDDRLKNVEAATEVGITGLHFKSADLLYQNFSQMGIEVSADEAANIGE